MATEIERILAHRGSGPSCGGAVLALGPTRALAKLSCPLDEPRNVHRQTHSSPASLPLGGASCTHTHCGE